MTGSFKIECLWLLLLGAELPVALPQQTVIKLQLYATRKKKKKERRRRKRSSFLNKLPGEVLQLALLTLCIQIANASLLFLNSEVHLKFHRLNWNWVFLLNFKDSWETNLSF